MDDFGQPPKDGWAGLVPELYVSDIAVSTTFWCGPIGFNIACQRPGEGFVYLQRPDGPQIMLCQKDGTWETGEMAAPFGRGVVLQHFVDSIAPIAQALAAMDWPLFQPERDVWRRWGDRMGGKREIMVQDPDGFLLLIAQDLGTRPLTEAEGRATR